MTAQKHTAGPWEADGTGGIIRTKTGVNERGGMTGGVCVAQFWTRPSKADARLIAASPDMLEALREAEEYFDNRADADCDETGFIPNEEMKLLTVVRAAIAKATGQ